MTMLRHIAEAMGGEVVGDRACFPSPGQSNADRGSWATLMPGAPDGVLIHSANGGNPLAIKDQLRTKGVLPGGERSKEARLHAVKLRDDQRIVSTWEFRRNGQLLYRTHRVEPGAAGRKKDFAYDHPDGAGGWKPKRGADPVPYRLDDLSRPGTVFMAEGESKADKLASWGLVATSSRHWRASFADLLNGRTVIILPDNDEEGRRLASEVARKLQGATVLTVALPDLPEKGDILDWEGTAAELCKLADHAMRALDDPEQAEPFRPAVGITARDLMAKTFPPIKYVVPGYVVEGLTVFAGAPKLGKSWAVLDWAIAVASGRCAFSSILCQQGDVLYLALEDNQRRLQSRLRSMRVSDAPDRLTFATEWPDLDGECIPRLREWLNAAKAPRLVIIDVFAKVRGAGTQRDTQYELDYKFTAQLQTLALLHGVAVVLVHHTRKQESDDPFDAVSGTRGLTGAADTVLVLKKEPGSQQPILYGRGRDLPEIESALTFDSQDCRWHVLGDAGMVAHTVERRAILSVLAKSADPKSPTEIAEALGKERSTINHTLTKLYEDG